MENIKLCKKEAKEKKMTSIKYDKVQASITTEEIKKSEDEKMEELMRDDDDQGTQKEYGRQ